MTDKALYIVSDETGSVVNMFATREAAQTFINTKGNPGWFIEEDSWC